MSDDELDRLLRHTLDDHRVSRGERRVLQQTFEGLGVADPQQQAYLRHRAFSIARSELESPHAKDVMEWLEDVVKILHPTGGRGLPRAEAYFSPSQDCVAAIERMFARSRQTVDVCVFTITDDRITRAMTESFQRGVKLRIISDNDKALDPGSDIALLRRLGVEVRVDLTPDHMHHKYAVFDRRSLLTGSYNWTRSASRRNEENLVISEDGRLIQAFQQNFDTLWRELAR